jgi:translocator protein
MRTSERCFASRKNHEAVTSPSRATARQSLQKYCESGISASYRYMNNNYSWYQQLIKPSWSPPSWIFGPVWTLLYFIIAASFGYVACLFFKGKISFVVFLPFILNIIFNLIFTPIQFGLKNNILAAIDILLVIITLAWAMKEIYPYAKWVTYANIPYLLWVIFATILQLSITWLNRE